MGSVVISIDAELGWGFHDLDPPPVARVEAGRRGWRHLLALLEEFRVPATWAVVGHLFLEDCDCRHADHPTPSGWFERERVDWRDRWDLRFAPDLVSDLLDARVTHDVGLHTFSHVVATAPWADEELYVAELRAATEAAAAHGVQPRSFVFPRNAVGLREALVETGVEVYRGPTPSRHRALSGPLGKLDAAARRSRARLVRPSVDEFGLVQVPPSIYLYGFEGVARTVVESVWTDPVVARAVHGIERASTEPGIYHLWLHPNNLVHARDVRRLRSVLEHVARLRRTSELEVETMADVADRTT